MSTKRANETMDLTVTPKGEEKGYRDLLINEVIVDAVYRNDKDINIIVYVMPGVNPAKIHPALQKSCIDIFGHRPPPGISTVYYGGGSLGLQAAGVNDQYDSFCVAIDYPKAAYYSLENLKDEFTKRIFNHLYGA